MLKAESITYYEFDRQESRPVRAFLISDHRILIDAFTDLTRSRNDFSIVGSITELGLIQRYFKAIPLSSVDVILIDATMKEANAAEVTQKLKEAIPDSKIIILGLEHDEDTILRFAEAGAAGYVLKQASLGEMSDTITAIHNGRSPCSSRVAASLFNKMVQLSRLQKDKSSANQVSLTVREQEILRLMSAGLNNKDIARHLNLASHTVKNHVHNILEKFQVHNRREAIKLARKQRLIDKSSLASMGLLQMFVLLSGQYWGLDINILIDNFISLF
jgi:DNA-binding NarL/FixJ family response regulator